MIERNESMLYQCWEKDVERQLKHNDYEFLAEKKFNQPIKHFLETELSEYKNEKMLDIGSGLYPETYQPDNCNFTCTDWLPSTQKTEKSYVCNAEELPFKGKEFGVVLSKQVHGYLINPEKCLDEMIRVLKPKGLLVLIDWEGDLKNQNYRVENFEPENVINKIETMGLEIIKSVRLIDRSKVIKDAYLTAIIAKKYPENSTRVNLENF